MLAALPIPEGSASAHQEVGALVASAFRLRDEAYVLEERAKKRVEAAITEII
jgi:hypothetical protein